MVSNWDESDQRQTAAQSDESPYEFANLQEEDEFNRILSVQRARQDLALEEEALVMNRYELWERTTRDPRWRFVEEFTQTVRMPVRTWWLDQEFDLGTVKCYVFASDEGGIRIFAVSGLSRLSVREVRAGAGLRPEDLQSICVCVWIVILMVYALEDAGYWEDRNLE